MTERILAAEALIGPDFQPAGPTEIVIEGQRIVALRPAPPDAQVAGLAMPAPVNAHDHARPLSATSFGLSGEPLETWLSGLGAMPVVDAGLAASAALARAAMGGVAAAMVHVTRPMGLVAIEEEAHQIADAAERIGIRIALALPLRDMNPLVYGDHDTALVDMATQDTEGADWLREIFARPIPPIADQIEMVESVAKALAGRPVDVQFGPTGPQWCSEDILSAVAQTSARTGRRVHMHLLETRYQRAWADAEHPEGITRWLQQLGLLSPRLSLAHCTWARPEDLAIMAACGVTVVVNTSSNLHLKSGVAPVRAMRDAGVDIALGIDGCALDEDDDALREMRLFKALHAGIGFDDQVTPERALTTACVTGRRALGLSDGGHLCVGAPADILLLDNNALDRDALLPVDPRSLVMARARREHIQELWVDGRKVVDRGRLVAFEPEAAQQALRDAYRVALPTTARFRAAWPALSPALRKWYHDRMGCC